MRPIEPPGSGTDPSQAPRSSRRWRHALIAAVAVAGALVVVSVTARDGDRSGPGAAAPAVPVGPPSGETLAALDELYSVVLAGPSAEMVERLGETGDPRVSWMLGDLLFFFRGSEAGDAAAAAIERLTGADLDPDRQWQSALDQLIAWDVPALDDLVDYKRPLYLGLVPQWAPLFDDRDAAVDWRYIAWGGVRIDDAPLGGTCSISCIPALDDPAVTDAAGGSWYPDERIVFGVEINGEARAYPKNIMEVHEMVNDTLGGRRIGLPYCTLCGSAQAFYTDDVAGAETTPLVLRTSGLLSRSNKVMYDFVSRSYFDTFAGVAVSGPLQDTGVVLESVGLQVTTWADWKAAHPDTTIVAEDGGVGRVYALDPLGGRDDDGAIFPIGDVDPRLPEQEQVIGVTLDDGTAVAFPVAASAAEIEAGGVVETAGARLVADGAGYRVETTDGVALTGHQSFWFAWSQFHPETALWQG